MKKLAIGTAVLGMVLALGAAQVFAQTSIGEMNAVTSGMNTLNDIGGGPSMAGGVRPVAPAAVGMPAPVGIPGAVRPMSAIGLPSVPPVVAPELPLPAGEVNIAPGARVVDVPPNAFVPDRAAQAANEGFKEMHGMRFQEAIQWYEAAKNLDSRYQPTYDAVVQASMLVDSFGVDMLSQQVIQEQPVKVTVGQYYGWNQ